MAQQNKRSLNKNAREVEKKQPFVVLKGIVGIPDGDGNIVDLHPYKTKDGKPVRDKSGSLVWEKLVINVLPSQVGHLVVNGSLILEKEFAEFYDDPDQGAKPAKNADPDPGGAGNDK